MKLQRVIDELTFKLNENEGQKEKMKEEIASLTKVVDTYEK